MAPREVFDLLLELLRASRDLSQAHLAQRLVAATRLPLHVVIASIRGAGSVVALAENLAAEIDAAEDHRADTGCCLCGARLTSADHHDAEVCRACSSAMRQ